MFIIGFMGALAPFLCLVRTFRVGLHSVPLSKGSKWASSDSGSARRFSPLPRRLLQPASFLSLSPLIIIIFLSKENIL